MKFVSAFLMVSGLVAAQSPQAPNPLQQSTENAARMAAGAMPIYRITVVERTTKAINYNHRSGSTKIDFRGTPLLVEARGEATVQSKQGVTKIDARMEKLQPATKFGPEYLTYVMWAITPEGRATNVGEVILNGDKSKLDATTELQSFGLIVTAEPYFAVTRPSDVVVMENFIRPDTVGTIEQVDAKYELLQRGQYILNANPSEISPVELNSKVPLDLYEARNAVRIARWTGADRYAPDTYLKATQGLENAEGYLTGKAGVKPIDTVAREAVQMAEDARIITVTKIEEERLATERQAAADRQSQAEGERAAAQADTARVTRDADTAQAAAQSEADRLKRENDAKMLDAQNAADQAKRDNAAQVAASQVQADQLKRENDAKMLDTENEADRAKRDNAAQVAASQVQADQLKRENDAKMLDTQNEADRAKRDNAAQTAASQQQADQLKRENDAKMETALNEMDRAKSDSAAQMTAAQNEADRLKLENDAKTAAAQTEADRLKRENEAQRASAQADLDRAAKEKAQAETERVELRALLMSQFNAILQTRDTARGLIVNMSDVLFDTGKFSLRPLAREKLAKVAGIVSGHPGLSLEVDGYTDSVGGDAYNQRLSEQRGESVRNYLTQEGMAASSVTSKGFGKTQPVASNETAAGRQQNRRVEIVISGDVIGTETGTPIGNR
jgi:outer membrane protein OmpA-like peptidoglycan-associated protein